LTSALDRGEWSASRAVSCPYLCIISGNSNSDCVTFAQFNHRV